MRKMSVFSLPSVYKAHNIFYKLLKISLHSVFLRFHPLHIHPVCVTLSSVYDQFVTRMNTGGTRMKTYSVYELAAKVGVSPQWIYKQLKEGGELSMYASTVDGKIRLSEEAIHLFRDKGENNPEPAPAEHSLHDDLIAALRDQIEVLKEQLGTKDRQIEQLQDTIRAELQLRMAAERRISLLEAPAEESAENDPPTDKTPSEGKINGSGETRRWLTRFFRR